MNEISGTQPDPGRGNDQATPTFVASASSQDNESKRLRRMGRPATKKAAAGQAQPPAVGSDASDLSAAPATRLVPAGFRRPPADPADHLAPGRFRRPPADLADHLAPGRFRRPPADPAQTRVQDQSPRILQRPPPDSGPRPVKQSSTASASQGSVRDAPAGEVFAPKPGAEHDRQRDAPEADPGATALFATDDGEIVAAIAAGDSRGVAAAYDKYAAALYGYCQWVLKELADSAEALQDTFVVAVTTIGDLTESTRLRPWMYALARRECRQRLRASVAPRKGDQEAATDPSARADGLPDLRGDIEPDDLLSLVCGVLAELPPREREVVELSLRHDLHDFELAEALGMSWSRSHALTTRAHARLEKALGALITARTGREACPELDALLADWDGHLTGSARDLIAGHVEQCQTCASHRLGGLRPAALSGLMPLAPLPTELREQVLLLCSSSAPDVAAYRRRITQRAESVWRARIAAAIWLVNRAGIRIGHRPTTATVTLAIWITLVFGTGITLLVFTGSHPSHALVGRLSPASSSPAARTTTATTHAVASPSPSPSVSLSPTPTPSPNVSQAQVIVPPSVEPSPTFSEPSPSASHSPTPSKSASPKPSKSASPTPSKSSSTSVGPSASTTG